MMLTEEDSRADDGLALVAVGRSNKDRTSQPTTACPKTYATGCICNSEYGLTSQGLA